MTDFKLANIILRVDEHAKSHPDLYFHVLAGEVVPARDGAPFKVSGAVDFLTYVNGLSACKWRRYAGLDAACLHIELTGAGDIEVIGVQEGGDAPRQLSSHAFEGEAASVLDIDIPLAGEDLIGFRVAAAAGSTVEIACAWYCARVHEDDINRVDLALSTTTFNNERYILPNIDLVKGAIAAEGEPIASHFHMFVVDNGRTLDAGALTDDTVTVIPNPNVGGSGGFARGMMAATEVPGAYTHVLLMDDDVRIMPESLIRTFNLLSLAKGRYREAFLNGAMLSLEEPARQFEDVSYVAETGVYRKVKEDLDVSEVASLLENERTDVEVDRAYGAWWYSCIPISAIERNGLPLPLFVRCDDVEFGIRNKPVYMTMNGICVWHASFEGRWRASVDCYQYTRNFHIMLALHDCADENLAVLRIRRNVRQNLRNMDYASAEMLLDGFEDYLKGPEFLEHANGAQLMKDNGKRNETTTPVSEVDPELLREAGVTDGVLGRGDMIVKPPHWLRFWRLFPYDKHYLPDFLLSNRPSYIVNYGPGTIEGTSLRRRTVVCLDPTRERAAVRHMDRERFRAIRKRERELLQRYRRDKDKIHAAYRQAMPYLTSRGFWESYLEEMGR